MKMPLTHILRDPEVALAARLGFEGEALQEWYLLPREGRERVLAAKHRFAGMSVEDADIAARRMMTPAEFYEEQAKAHADMAAAVSYTMSQRFNQSFGDKVLRGTGIETYVSAV